MDLNKVQIIWNITQDIELRQTPNWQNVTSFSIATNRFWVNKVTWERQEQTEFHNIVLWAKLAEIADQYLKKGDKIYIEWRLQTRNWEAQDGTKRYKTEIIGENMIMLWAKWWNNKSEYWSTIWEVKPEKKQSPKNDSPAVEKKQNKQEEDISIEDIPF